MYENFWKECIRDRIEGIKAKLKRRKWKEQKTRMTECDSSLN
jgi:hypothetical protein